MKLVAAGLGIALSVGIAGAAFAADKTVTGSLIDTFCYAGMGAHGPSHKECATKCAKAGIPVGLLEKGTNKIYVLLPTKDEQPLPDEVKNKMEEEVTVTGKAYDKGGVKFLTVESVK